MRTRGLADTSVFIARESGRPLREQAFPGDSPGGGVPVLTQDDDYDGVAGLDGLEVIKV